MANLTDKLTEIKTHINTLEEHLKDLQEKNRKSSSIKARASAQSAKTLLHSLRKGIMEAVKSIPPKRTNVGSKKALVVPAASSEALPPRGSPNPVGVSGDCVVAIFTNPHPMTSLLLTVI